MAARLYSIDGINTVNSTSLRIVWSLHIATAYALMVLAGVMLGRITDGNDSVVSGLGWIITSWLAVDMVSFAAKRFSDAGYAAAKNVNTPSPVTVEAPATVNVETQGGDTKTSVRPAAPAPITTAEPLRAVITGQQTVKPVVRDD